MSATLISKKEINDLILKVLTDEAGPDECALLLDWIKRSEGNRVHFIKVRNSWLAASQTTEVEKSKTRKALEAVNRKISTSKPHEANTPPGSEFSEARISSLRVGIRTAALWILLFGSGALFSVIILRHKDITIPGAKTEIFAPRGSKAMTVLPDGTTVWLNAGSKIRYRIPWRKAVRDVTLEGEAYFNVSEDLRSPFTVHAGSVIVIAYGTEFNVKAYPDEKLVETTLVRGSVSVEIKDVPSNKTMLKPNEQAVYYMPASGRSENFLVTRGIDPSLFTLWVKDRLQIRGETLEALAIILERKYDVKINFDNIDLKQLRFTGMIENETIEQILELIKISSDVEYRMEGREIWFSKSGIKKN